MRSEYHVSLLLLRRLHSDSLNALATSPSSGVSNMMNVKEFGCLLVFALSASAQTGGPVQGVVRDRMTGTGVAGASVTFFTKDAARYQVSTDAAGTFHIADMEPGQYQALIEKSGFAMFPENSFQIGRGGAPIELQYQMQFGVLPRATLSGRVPDSSGRLAASAATILIRGPEPSFTTTVGGDGHFAFVQVDPGAYTLLAEPSSVVASAPSEGPRTEDVATYFPSSTEASAGAANHRAGQCHGGRLPVAGRAGLSRERNGDR